MSGFYRPGLRSLAEARRSNPQRPLEVPRGRSHPTGHHPRRFYDEFGEWGRIAWARRLKEDAWTPNLREGVRASSAARRGADLSVDPVRERQRRAASNIEITALTWERSAFAYTGAWKDHSSGQRPTSAWDLTRYRLVVRFCERGRGTLLGLLSASNPMAAATLIANSDAIRPPIPIRSRPPFRFEAGHHSEMKPATRAG
jgi:hypothetical protein